MSRAEKAAVFLKAAIVIALLLGGLVYQTTELGNRKAELEAVRKQTYLEGYRDGMIEALKGTGKAELVPLIEELRKAGKL